MELPARWLSNCKCTINKTGPYDKQKNKMCRGTNADQEAG